MFIDANGKSINIHVSFTDGDTVYPNLRDPAVQAAVGVTEIADPVPPEDYAEDLYFRTEQDTAPYVVYTKRSDAMIATATRNRLLAQINSLEATSQLPRITREFLLEQIAAASATQGVDPMANPGYVKLKTLDDQVNALRAQLV